MAACLKLHTVTAETVPRLFPSVKRALVDEARLDREFRPKRDSVCGKRQALAQTGARADAPSSGFEGYLHRTSLKE
jgi:hypothetical protein